MNELLRQYAEDGDEAAFAEFVRQTVNLVHSAALRQVYGDPQLAEEVTQTVFLDLARKSKSLARHTALTGWLYTSTRYAATKAMRAQQRWRHRTREAQAMHDLPTNGSNEAAWTQMRFVLDAAMGELGDRDREALLLRYFEDRPLAEVGARIGLSENSARMRVDRALDKLRAVLAKRGVTSTAAALALLLSQQGVVAAPAGLAASAASTALAGAGIGSAGTLTLAKLLLGLAAVAGTAGVVAVWYQSAGAPPAVAPANPTTSAPAGLPQASNPPLSGGRGGAAGGTARGATARANVNGPLSIPGGGTTVPTPGRVGGARGGGGGGGTARGQ